LAGLGGGSSAVPGGTSTTSAWLVTLLGPAEYKRINTS